MLPETLPLKTLETLHIDHQYYREEWITISQLREGYRAIRDNVAYYLPMRPGESLELYQLRIKKLAYTPVMSNAIREFSAKLASAPVAVSGVNYDDGWWNLWKVATDGRERSEQELLGDIFSSLLYFGSVFLCVDLPRTGATPRSRAEDPDTKPYVTVWEPLNVTNWGDDWLLVRQVLPFSSPTETTKLITRWTYYTAEEIAVYEAVSEIDAQGRLKRILGENGQWKPASYSTATVKQAVSFRHGLGSPPIAIARLKPELWVGKQVYPKQIQHLIIESSWTDAGSIAGTVQRIFTPRDVPQEDPRVPRKEPDYSGLKPDNAHVLIGADFAFVESEGKALANLESQLDKIEQQIRHLVSMGWMSVQDKAVSQSGTSKEVDMALLEDAMRHYGRKVATVYQSALRVVARLANRPEQPTVSGLDSYATDTLGEVLGHTLTLMKFAAYVPKTALYLWFAKLANLMVGTVSDEDAQQLQDELEAITFDTVGIDTTSKGDRRDATE